MADHSSRWQQLKDDQGNIYYHDTVSNTTSWSLPPPPPPDSAPTAPPLSSSDSYSMNPYPQQAGSYHHAPSTFPPSSMAQQSSPPIAPHQHSQPGPPDYHTAPQSQQSRPYQDHPQQYPPQGNPSHNQSYPMNSPSYSPQTPPYASPPHHGSPPNGASSSHHPYPFHQQSTQAPPLHGEHQSYPGGYGPTSRPSYLSQSQSHFQQTSYDPQPPPPRPPRYALQNSMPQPHHSYTSQQSYRPPTHNSYAQGHGGPPAPSTGPPGGHTPLRPPEYGRPPAHDPYGHGSPSAGPGSQTPPPPGYPSVPSQSGQQHNQPHQHSYQQSYPPQPTPYGSHAPNIQADMSSVTTGLSQLSMGMGPNSKLVPISLEFRAAGLRDRDFIGKSDPVLHVLVPKDNALSNTDISQWKRFGSTEVISNNVNPTWAQRVKVRFCFERHQPLRFELVDIDKFKTMQGDHLGFATTTLAEIVRNGVVKLPLRRKNGGTGRGELTVRAHDDNPAGKVRLQLSLAGRNLDKKDFMGKSDPYYRLLHVLPGGTSTLYKSEEKKNDCNPTWKPHTVLIHAAGTPWTQISLAVEVYDWDKYTPHDLIGEIAFSLSDLSQAKAFPLINKKKQAKKGSRYKNSGELLVHRADAAELPSFISYLQGGLRLEFIVAIDFTASNRPVDNPESLHYMDNPSQPSQYYQALYAVGTILSDYLSDGRITALGFGAKLPGQGGQACFDFALNGQVDAHVQGVQGLLDAYRTAVRSVTLAGPTYFTPIIRKSMEESCQVPVSQTNQHFAVLLILTDGIITDLPATIDTIIEASHKAPIAIVIVGIGNTDFRAMERLDGDNFKLRSDHGDKVAKHDIVQFTKYDPTKPIEYLAADVLQEVPQRVVEYMSEAGIKPNPPLGPQPSY